ncbi:MAG: peptidylprolyl isomerase, partial [Paracoccaceae bacterium]
MTKLTRFLSAITITCALSLPASSQEITADTVVATVNGINITIGHMIVLRNNLPEQYNNLDDKTLFSGILDQVVQQSVLAQTVSEPSPAIALQLENERRSLLAGAAM